MAFNFRLNLQSVFRRLGIQSGARLPQLENDVRMVMVITDLSRLIPAPIEPRAICGANIPGAVGLHSFIQLRSLSGGGIFVETVMIRRTGAAINENVIINITDVDAGLPVFPQLDIGGTPVESVFTAGTHAVIGGGVRIPSPSGFETWGIPLGIFVPNQRFLTINPGFSNTRNDISLFYRELRSIEEVG